MSTGDSMSQVASFLIIHGSRDPRPGHDLTILLDQLRLVLPDVLLGGGQLECSDIPLSEQILEFSHQAQAKQYSQVQLLPLFLLPGVHVCEDLPAEVATAQTQSQISLNLLPYLGTKPGLVDYLSKTLEATPKPAWIFLAHGSKRVEALAWVDHLAAQLNATPAYWTQPESLKLAITKLSEQGHREIGIFPYFLFAGKLLDFITTQVEALQYEFPNIRLHLHDCLRPQAGLVPLIINALEPSDTIKLSSNP